MGYGPKGTCPAGSLPVFSVDTEKEAEQLIQLACKVDSKGLFYAPELAQDQTLENLHAFGDRLADLYEKFIKNTQIDENNA